MSGVREVQIPKVGMSSTEVDITQWFVGVGDRVQSGTPLVEIESEKVTVVVESEVDGAVAELLVSEGDVVEVGAVVCRISVDD